MKSPGPDHPITVSRHPNRVRVLFQGHMIAETAGALTLAEASYRPVIYVPRQDVALEYLSRTDSHTHCPYKGDAAYYTIMRDGDVAQDAVWTYEHPYPAVGEIRGFLAFYPDQVIIEETPLGAGPNVDEIGRAEEPGQTQAWTAPQSPDHALKVGRPYKDTGAL